MLGNIHVFMAGLGFMVFSGFLVAYLSHKWDD